jgi:ABC-2 type transport system ATP-binding protein
VEAICNRVVIIAGGRVRAIDTPANLNASLQGFSLIQLTLKGAQDAEVQEALGQVKGVRTVLVHMPGSYHIETEPGRDTRPDLAKVVIEKGWDLFEISTRQRSLEDIFLQIIRSDKNGEPLADPLVQVSAAEPVMVAPGGLIP